MKRAIALLLLFACVASCQLSRRFITGGTLPPTCSVGQGYFKTGATPGMYWCLTTNTWTIFVAEPFDADLTAIAALTCTENQIIKRDGAGVWICAADATGGSPTFDQVEAGTNTAALVIGTGGSLGASGSGAIVATSTSGNAGTATALAANPSACTAGKYVTDTAADGTLTCESPKRVVQVVAFDFATDTATGDGKFYFYVPAELNGMNLVAVHAQVITAGTTNLTNVDLARCATTASGNACSGTVSDMLSTNLTIDSGENSSTTAATAAVIDTSYDDVATGQIVRVDVDAVSTTTAKGLIVTMEFQLP